MQQVPFAGHRTRHVLSAIIRTLAESCESTEPGDHEDLDGESSCDSSSACGADLGSQFKHDTVPRIQSPSPSRACEAAPRHPPPLRWRSMTCDQDPVGGWTPRNPRVPALETPTVQSGAKCVESPHSGSSTQGRWVRRASIRLALCRL